MSIFWRVEKVCGALQSGAQLSVTAQHCLRQSPQMRRASSRICGYPHVNWQQTNFHVPLRNSLGKFKLQDQTNTAKSCRRWSCSLAGR